MATRLPKPSRILPLSQEDHYHCSIDLLSENLQWIAILSNSCIRYIAESQQMLPRQSKPNRHYLTTTYTLLITYYTQKVYVLITIFENTPIHRCSLTFWNKSQTPQLCATDVFMVGPILLSYSFQKNNNFKSLHTVSLSLKKQ